MDPHPFYRDREKLTVEHDGEWTTQICERIPLNYPLLAGRAEVCMGHTRDGGIYAAVAASCGAGGESIEPTQRLFRSSDGGYTWSGRSVELPGEHAMTAFTILAGDVFLIAATAPSRGQVRFWRSTDRGSNWQAISEIPAEPFEQIARAILDRPPCARTIAPADPGRLAGLVLDDARKCGAKGVIAHVMKFCDPYLARLPAVRQALKEANVPLLVLEGDCSLRSLGQHRTRIEAFVEMVGG